MNPGEKLHKYTIVRELGRGGMGGVYVAEESGTGRQVAIKTLFKRFAEEDAYVRRFQREAQVYRQLDHPNIVRFIESGFDAGTYFIVLEYVRGKSLHEILQAVKRLDPATALKIIIALAEALKHAHDRGIVHRDLKPSNVIIDDSGTVKLLDFGVAHKDDRLVETQEGTVVGTYFYAAPEQNQGKTDIDARTDLYTLGILFYELLAGVRPFDGDLLEVAQQQARESYRPLEDVLPNLPPFFPPLIRRMMAKAPENRYQAAGEMLEELRAALIALTQRPRGGGQPAYPAPQAPPPAYEAPASGYMQAQLQVPTYQAQPQPMSAQIPPPMPGPPPVTPGGASTGKGELDTRWITAKEAFQRHQLDQAQELVEAVLRSEPAFAAGFALLGKIHAAKGFSYNAIEAFKRASALVPTDVNVHMDFAMALYSMKLPEKAREAFEAVLRLDPKNMLANRYLTLLAQVTPQAPPPPPAGRGMQGGYPPPLPQGGGGPAPYQDPGAEMAGRRQRFLDGLGVPAAGQGPGGDPAGSAPAGNTLANRLDNFLNVPPPVGSGRGAFPGGGGAPPVTPMPVLGGQGGGYAQGGMGSIPPAAPSPYGMQAPAYQPPPDPYQAAPPSVGYGQQAPAYPAPSYPVSVPPGRGRDPEAQALKQRTPDYIPPPKPIVDEEEPVPGDPDAPAGARFSEKRKNRRDDEDDDAAIDPERAWTFTTLWWGLGAAYVGLPARGLMLTLLEAVFVGLMAAPFHPQAARYLQVGAVSLAGIANWLVEQGVTGNGGFIYEWLYNMDEGWSKFLTQLMRQYGFGACMGLGGLGFLYFETSLPGKFVRRAQFANLKGRILEVRRDMTLKVSLGEERGVKTGMVFEVQKRKHVDALSQLNFKTMLVAPEVFTVGLAKVVSTTPHFSICKFKRTPGQSSNPSNGDRIVVVKDARRDD